MDLHSLDMDMVHDDPEDGRWEAFVRRDPGADGQFVVAVETTCIYCRPTCPARRPLRKNVRFLPDAATAERQGYRACKRCKPQLAQLPSEALVERVKSLLLADSEAPPSLDALARATALSPAHLQKTFKKHTGLSPKEFVSAARLERWKAELRAGKPVTEAWLEAGYGSAGRAYAAARKQMGMSPAQYGKGGAGQRITWLVLDTPLGALLLARTEKGLCRVAFGEGASGARVDAPLGVPGGGAGARLTGVGCTAPRRGGRPREPSGAEHIPLDVRATGFQRQVWQALRCHPQRDDGELRRRGALGGSPPGGARGGPRVRDESRGPRRPLPPRRALRRQPLRLPLGAGAQARAAGRREGLGRGRRELDDHRPGHRATFTARCSGRASRARRQSLATSSMSHRRLLGGASVLGHSAASRSIQPRTAAISVGP